MKSSPAYFLSAMLVCASASGAPAFLTGQGARVIIGQATFTDALPKTDNRSLGAAGGVAFANNILFVADSVRFSGTTPQNRRVVMYRDILGKVRNAADPIPPDISRCPVCTGRGDFPFTFDNVLGQPDYTKNDQAISQAGMRLPTAVASDGRVLAVADTENNRVLIWNSIPSTVAQPADIVLGQDTFDKIQQPIVVTASSFRGPQGVWIQDGRLYVADTQNHRVLIWRSIPTRNNQAADLVLGQANFTTAPEPDLTKLTSAAKANNLLNPVSVTSDGRRLYVTDLGFNRVLIWNSIPDQNTQAADVVIGEPDMDTNQEGGNDATKVCDSTGTDSDGKATYPDRCAATLSFPRFALSDGQRLYIADGGNDRVLIFNSIPTSNGAKADVVLGQIDFTSNRISDEEDIFTPNLQRSAADIIRTPTSLAWDGQNLYVADPFDRRVLVFSPAEPNVPLNGVRNAASFEVYAVGSIAFTAAPKEDDQITIKIADKEYVYKAKKDDKIPQVVLALVDLINANGGDPNVLAIANVLFNTITLTSRIPGEAGNNITVTSTLSDNAQLAATVVAPSGGRDAAKIAPGTLVSIVGENLTDSTASAPADAETLPTTLGNTQVYFDGIRAPLLYVSPTQINAQMPYEVLDTTSVTSWVRSVRSNGAVTVTTAVAVPITLQNPGIFAQSSVDPRPAYAYHYSSGATLSILVDGTIKENDVATITIEDRPYAYTVKAADTLFTVRDALIALINANGDEKVTAEPGGSFSRVILRSKLPGDAGNGLPVTGTTNTGASLTISTSRDTLCCGNLAGAPVTPDNPAIAGEMIFVWAAGLGIVKPEEARLGLRTGQTYIGPVTNDPNSFVSSLAGGRTANVISAGAEPGKIGLYRVVLELNADLPTNPATQLTIAQDVYVSNIVTIPVVNPNPVQ